MKYSIILGLAFSLAIASPLQDRAKAAAKPAAVGTKKPFQPPASLEQTEQLCGNGLSSFNAKARSEDCLGTEEFCALGLFKETSESFKSVNECMNSRVKKPFLEPVSLAESDEVCGTLSGPSAFDKKGTSEACVGTDEYCTRGFYATASENFANAENCFNSRIPGPDAISFPGK